MLVLELGQMGPLGIHTTQWYDICCLLDNIIIKGYMVVA